jgi:hypothetical protein
MLSAGRAHAPPPLVVDPITDAVLKRRLRSGDIWILVCAFLTGTNQRVAGVPAAFLGRNSRPFSKYLDARRYGWGELATVLSRKLRRHVQQFNKCQLTYLFRYEVGHNTPLAQFIFDAGRLECTRGDLVQICTNYRLGPRSTPSVARFMAFNGIMTVNEFFESIAMAKGKDLRLLTHPAWARRVDRIQADVDNATDQMKVLIREFGLSDLPGKFLREPEAQPGQMK